MELINLRYDLTPHHYLSMVVCEFGNIPPHSVPNVIKEMAKLNDDDDEFDESSDEDSMKSDSQDDLFQAADEMREQDEEDSDEDDTRAQKESANSKRM